MIKIQRFQLHELITVVVLASLLVFLMFSMPSIIRPRASMSNCTGNLKQLGNASALYEGDNWGDRPGPQPLGQENVLVSWDRPLAIQMGANLGPAGISDPLASLTKIPPHAAAKTLATFTCPAEPLRDGARMVPKIPGSLADGMATGKGICRSYSLNLGSGLEYDGILANAQAISITRIESGAGTVQIVENHGYATVFGQSNIANDTTVVCSPVGKMVPADILANRAAAMHGVRNRPRSNALMYDGHVEVLDQPMMVFRGGEIMQIGKRHGEPFPAKEETP